MTRVLCVDVGVTNLGLVVMEYQGSNATIIAQDTVSVGKSKPFILADVVENLSYYLSALYRDRHCNMMAVEKQNWIMRQGKVILSSCHNVVIEGAILTFCRSHRITCQRVGPKAWQNKFGVESNEKSFSYYKANPQLYEFALNTMLLSTTHEYDAMFVGAYFMEANK